MNTAHHRRTIRLRGWDYASAGAYFVTLVTHQREELLGEVVDGAVVLSAYGSIAAEEWVRTPDVRPNVEMDVFVVMPNHVHGIIWIVDHGRDLALQYDVAREAGASQETGARHRREAGARHRLAPTVVAGSLGAIVGGYKSVVARRINDQRGTRGAPVWQRNYYERIIRNERELAAIRRYIQQNPANWADDTLSRPTALDFPPALY